MDSITSITEEEFRKYFIEALQNIGVGIKDSTLFCENDSKKRLIDMGICTTISMKIDEFMEAKIHDYKGCLPNDDYETIVSYNFLDY